MHTNHTKQQGKALIEYKINIMRISLGKISVAESEVIMATKIIKTQTHRSTGRFWVVNQIATPETATIKVEDSEEEEKMTTKIKIEAK